MNYKPDEKDWMAYLYGELEGEDKQKIERYLLENTEARTELAKFQSLRKMLSSVEDKEVIAPPIFIDGGRQRFLWNTPYSKLIVSIAASLLLIIIVGRATNTRMNFTGNGFAISFGEAQAQPEEIKVQEPALTAGEVQQMIDASLEQNNSSLQASLNESQQKLNASIRKNLADNSGKIDQLIRNASLASQEQIQQYVVGIQSQNQEMLKDYFQLTAGEQKKYIEDILVDFSQYLQQQRENDLQLVETKFKNLEQNTDSFKQETEQILTSIISSVGTGRATPNGIRN